MNLDNSLIDTNTRNQTLRDITVLVLIALVIGIYLILTTVVVSRDSITYLHRAQWLQDNHAEILANRPSGYEVLILLSHRLFYAATGNNSIRGWIWAAQGMTLLCKVLAIIILYLVGCRMTHRKNSFWGCVILLFLPEPAHWGSDVLREWPYLLFMGLSVLSLLGGIRKNRFWLFALVGMWAGIGYLIRLESIQLLLVGLLVLLLLIFNPPKSISRRKLVLAGILMIAGFAGPVLAYAGYSGQITNNYLKHYIEKVIPGYRDSESEKIDMPAEKKAADTSEKTDTSSSSQEEDASSEIFDSSKTVPESPASRSLPKFAYELFKDTGELLLWLYFPFWIIGIYVRLRDKTDPMIRWIIAAFIVLGIGMILMRYFYKEAIVTQRWILPLITITVFYIYSGIEKVGIWIDRKKEPHLQSPQKWAFILMSIGILIGLVNILEPIGTGNETYLQAADWIQKNSKKTDWLYTYDRRITFYAERGYIEYEEEANGFELKPYAAVGLIIPATNKHTPDTCSEKLILETSFGLDDEKEEAFYIYRYDRD